MAPQNVSFIDSSADDGEDESTPTASKRLSQMNITSGSKTYRVHEKETSPSPTRTRPTLSSAFKQARRGSETGSGPSSLRSNSGVGLTEEEAETLAAMKTEALKDDADASKGFVISFDSEAPKVSLMNIVIETLLCIFSVWEENCRFLISVHILPKSSVFTKKLKCIILFLVIFVLCELRMY